MTKNVKRCKQVREQFLQFLTDLEEFVKGELATAKFHQVKLYLTELQDRYKHFLKSQTELEDLDETEYESDVRIQVDKRFFNIKPQLEERIDEIKTPKQTILEKKDEELSFKPKLPELILESFSGDITKWKSFIESFDNHVHKNPRLNVITKYQYLRNSVKGFAAKTFENLDFISDNYEEARKLLIERFDKPNYIAEEHIRSMFSIKSIDKPNAKKLLELLDEYNSHLRSLHTLGRPVNYWDDLIVFMMVSKFDPETKIKWRDEAPSDHLASYEELTTFVKNRSHKLDGYGMDHLKSSKPISSQRRSFGSLSATQTVFFCKLCNTNGHSILRCKEFENLPVDERRKNVEKWKLCFNCLRSNHFTSNCPIRNDRCRICKKSHHTLLHIDQNSYSTTDETTNSAKPQSSASSLPTNSVSLVAQSGASLNSSTTYDVPSYVFLATALVQTYNNFDTPVAARVLLDSGSQVNFVTESFASKLGLKQEKSNANVRGIGCSMTQFI